MTGTVRFIVVCLLGSMLGLGAGVRAVEAQVTAPAPADKATNVPVSTSLSWRADPKANRYDVSFGTTNPPPVALRNQSATTYQPAPLAASTTYYWRVDSKGAKNYSATGVVWSFTTGTPPTPPPAMPTGPAPQSGATGVLLNVALSWAASTNATTYDVAFGTVSPPPIVSAGQTATTYQPPAPLSASRTYYWGVIAKGPGGATSGPIWTFTTAAPPTSARRDRLRLLTWNIQSGRDATGANAVEAQAALMADSGADVIALQEVTITPDYGDLTALYKSRLESLTGTTWYQVWAPAPRASTYTPEGNVLLSRIPFFSSATTQFDTVVDDPAWTDTKRSAAAITIVVNDVQVTVLNTHMPVDPNQRQRHLDLFQAWASSFQTPRLVGGDFNMLPGDAVYADMTGSLVDVWPVVAGGTEYGFTKDVRSVAPFQPGRIDYWFQEPVDARARASETWVVKTGRSDHHAVVVDVDVR